MGLLSSSNVVTVGTFATRVVKDADVIPSYKTGLISGLVSDTDQLSENILESLLGGAGVRVESMYNYAKTKYTYGLPSAKVISGADGASVVVNLLKGLFGSNLISKYCRIGTLNNLHASWIKLVSTYGYNNVTNELSSLSTSKGVPVYLTDMVIVIKDITDAERLNGSLELWGTPATYGPTNSRLIDTDGVRTPSPIRLDATVAGDCAYVTYEWKTVEKVPMPGGKTIDKITYHTDNLTMPITGYDLVADYVQVEYSVGSSRGYWLYKVGAGTYPEIDTFFVSGHTTSGRFFPRSYFRYNKTNFDSDKTSARYKTTEKMVKYLGIDYQKTIDAIKKNPQIEDVDQAMLMMVVPADTKNQVEQRYLFDFFSKLYLDSGGIGVGLGGEVGNVQPDLPPSAGADTSTIYAMQLAIGLNLPKIAILIDDGVFKTALTCRAIFKRTKAGVIGAVNTYASSFITEDVEMEYTVWGRDSNNEPILITNVGKLPIDSYIYQKQISDHVYEEVQVYDLKMTYYIWDKFTKVGNDKDKILLIPLDDAITSQYSLTDKESLYVRSMHFIFNAIKVTHLAWYQSEFFQFVMLAIAIIVTIVSLGEDGGALITAVLAGKMTIEAFILSMAWMLAKGILISLALRVFIKVVGIRIAFIAAIIAALAGSYMALDAGSIAGAPWAKELLALSSNLSKAVTDDVGRSIKSISSAYTAFLDASKSGEDALTAANKLLETTKLLNPMVIFGESPDDFYNRTVHSGNIGIVGIDSVSSYVEVALRLPKFNDTLGNDYGLSDETPDVSDPS